MGKPYDHRYFFAGHGGTAGTMICASCNQTIFNHAHDWMHYSKTYKDASGWTDWKYVCFHRKCCSDQSGWEILEKSAKDASDKHERRISSLKKLAGELGITCEVEFASLAYDALNTTGGDLDDYYLSRYGSC